MRWTLPNILTLARIGLTPVIALLPFISGYWPKVIAFFTFIAVACTDIIDGWLARKYNQVSELGQLLDPIADKLMLFAMLVPIFWITRHPTILVDYRIPWWGSVPVWALVLLVGREPVLPGEPRDGGADEDVLHRRLELPRPDCRDHDAAALGEEAERGD